MPTQQQQLRQQKAWCCGGSKAAAACGRADRNKNKMAVVRSGGEIFFHSDCSKCAPTLINVMP